MERIVFDRNAPSISFRGPSQSWTFLKSGLAANGVPNFLSVSTTATGQLLFVGADAGRPITVDVNLERGFVVWTVLGDGQLRRYIYVCQPADR